MKLVQLAVHRAARAAVVAVLATGALLSQGVGPAAAADGTVRFATNAGVSSYGYAWQNQGLDYYRASTANGTGVKFNFSRTSAWAGIDTKLQSSLSTFNSYETSIPFTYGATVSSAATVPTSLTARTADNAWLVRAVPTSTMQSQCPGWTSTLVGCAVSQTVSIDGGKNFFIDGCTVFIDGTKYAANPSYPWQGIMTHELLHCVGLDHYTAIYGGYQALMYPTISQNSMRQGDLNGLRAMTKRV